MNKYTTLITRSEYSHAWSEAGRRREILRASRDQNSGQGVSTTPESEVWSVMAEIIVGRFTGSYPSALKGGYDPDDADLSNGIEVRATHHFNGRLIIRKKDRERAHRYFVLVTYKEMPASLPQFVIHGAIKGADAMVDRFWEQSWGNGGDPSWLVPQSALTDLRLILPNLNYQSWGKVA